MLRQSLDVAMDAEVEAEPTIEESEEEQPAEEQPAAEETKVEEEHSEL